MVGVAAMVAVLFGVGRVCAAEAVSGPALRQLAQSWVTQFPVDPRLNPDRPWRLQVDVGALDARLKLAPCDRMEPFVPNGQRLWGRSSVGIRCLEGPVRWNVYLPVRVRVMATAWVLIRPISAGQVLSPDDARLQEVDWAEDESPVLATESLWVGNSASRALAAGQTLRRSLVKAPTVLVPGQIVKVVVQGDGFVIGSQATALTPAAIGDSTQVRLETGRLVNGQVRQDKSVQIQW